MSQMLKKYLRSSILTSVLLIILGCLLVFKSEVTIISISYIVGGVLIGLGVVALIRYAKYTDSETNSELDILYGIVTMILGYLVITHPKTLASVIPFILGIFIILNSSTKMQYAIELKKEENNLWIMTMIVSIISAICGVVLTFNPFKGAQMITQIIGIFIATYGILDIISTLTIRKNVITIQTAIENTIKDAEIIDETDKSTKKNKKRKK